MISAPKDSEVKVSLRNDVLLTGFIENIEYKILDALPIHIPQTYRSLTPTLCPSNQIMQAWSLQSQRCVFCQSRWSRSVNSLAQQSRYASGAGVHRMSAPRRKSLSNIPRKISLDQKRKGRVTLSELNSSKFERPGDIQFSKSRFNKERQEEEEFYERLVESVRKRLNDVETDLRKTSPTQEDHISQLQRLDPTGQRWPAFKSSINSLLTKPVGIQSDEEKTLINRFALALRQSNADLQTQLHFEFLDRCLSSLLKKSPISAYDLRYPTEWYSSARKRQRVIHLHVGPTNSGKTYNALKRLQEAQNGFYAGPLRLLAHEVYSRFRANGVKCDLITGDDVRLDESGEADVYASTVEMVNVTKEVEVAVIDEIQMLSSEDRGWAWTRAFLGANANEVHLCGETRVVPLIRELTASMGDSLKIHRYERLNPLVAEARSLRGNLKRLQKGDCVVCFSIMGIHALKKQIEVETGRRVAIVYGSLPPETRAAQADLFNDPNNDYDFLVASDAIGMGLNLSIRRIVFETTIKFNGVTNEPLTIPQVKQIAGRAGRYRTARQDKVKDSSDQAQNTEPGLVTCLENEDLPLIHAALNAEAPPLRKAMILPPAEYLEEFSLRLPPGMPFEYLYSRVCQTAQTHPRFAISNVKDKLKVARITDSVPNLSIEERAQFAACPVGGRDPRLAICVKALAQAVADRRAVTVADVPEIPLEILAETPNPNQNYLSSLEALHQCLTLFLWLSYRFLTFFKDQPMAFHAKELAEHRINWTLTAFSANPKLRQKIIATRQKMTKESSQHAQSEPVTSETIAEEQDTLLGASEAQTDGDEKTADREEAPVGGNSPTRSEWTGEQHNNIDDGFHWEERPADESFITAEERSEIRDQEPRAAHEPDTRNDGASRQTDLSEELANGDTEQPRAASAGS